MKGYENKVIKALFSCAFKIFEIEFFHIWSIKYKLIIKLITELVYKLRDKFIKTNEFIIST